MKCLTSLQNYFLVATPSLAGSFWQKAVIYMCEHDPDEGSMGIMVNNPLPDITFSHVVKGLNLPPAANTPTAHGNEPIILTGGPVETNRGFVLHDEHYTHESTLHLAPHIHLTATADIVRHIAQGHATQNLNFCLGYAGWSAGQLEEEIAENSWLMLEADPEILYKTPTTERYQACLSRLGINPERISTIYGHA